MIRAKIIRTETNSNWIFMLNFEYNKHLNKRNSIFSVLAWILVISFIAVLIFSIRDLFISFVFGLLLSYLLKAPVELLNKIIKNRALAFWFLIIIILSLFTLISYLFAPIVSSQFHSFQESYPSLVQTINQNLSRFGIQYQVDTNFEGLSSYKDIISKIPFGSQNFLNIFGNSIRNTFNVLAMIIVISISTVLLTIDGDKIWNSFLKILPNKIKDKTIKVGHYLDQDLEALIYGQFKLAVMTSIVMLITYIIIGSKFAFLLALIQMLEIIPIVGTWIGFVPAFILILITMGMNKALIVLGVYWIYSQGLRDQYITPKIYGDAFGVHPLAMIFGILIGIKVFGLLGIVAMLPIIALLNSMYKAKLDLDSNKK